MLQCDALRYLYTGKHRVLQCVVCCSSVLPYVAVRWSMSLLCALTHAKTPSVLYCGAIVWLRYVGSLKSYVSFAQYRLFYRALLQKRPIILRSPLSVATPYCVTQCATHCNTATQANTASASYGAAFFGGAVKDLFYEPAQVDRTLQHTATRCNTLQHTHMHCNTRQHTAIHGNTRQHNATPCNTRKHNATHGNTRLLWRSGQGSVL